MENRILRGRLILLISFLTLLQSSLVLAFFDFSSWFSSGSVAEQHVPVTKAVRADFFEELIGVSEPEYVKNQERLLRKIVRDGRVHNIKTKTSLPAGVFKPCSIAQLDALVEEKPSRGRGTFNVVVGYNTKHLPLEKRAQLDIGALQADAENKDALFQLASNFDCRENASSVGDGHHWISEYIYDMTQGPFAAISAAPGLFYRCYCARPINLLKNFPYLPLRKGYLVLDAADSKVLKQADDLDYEQVMVGVHRDVGVMYGQLLNANEHLTCGDKEQTISQVYVSSLDLGLASGNALGKKLGNDKVRERVEALAKKLLLAAYQGTIKAAIAFDKQKVFLTLVGCGVFNNRLAWVQEAIESCVDDIMKFGLDVTLVVYDANTPNTLKEMPAFLGHMKKIVDNTHGEYRELFDAFGYMQSPDRRGRLC